MKETTSPDRPLVVNLGERSYPIHIGAGLLQDVGRLLHDCGFASRMLLVTDKNVRSLYAGPVSSSLAAAGFEAHVAAIPAGETSKSLAYAGKLYDAAVDAGLDRKSAVVALGGGVVGDLAGFVAATYARAISFAQIPTTLLAMVDSAVGGKVGIDHPKAKNIIGAFHQPRFVLCDIECLKTLPDREYRSGLAEVVKYGVILDADFFMWLENHVAEIADRDLAALSHIVRRSCELKAQVVEKDERETSGLRAILNYGHTFAHAMETVTDYSRFSHGEAVAIGMMCAARLAVDLGMVDADLVDQQDRLWQALSLPTKLSDDLSRDRLLQAMQRDKKTVDGKLRFVLPTELGEVRLVDNVPESAVRKVLT